MIVIKILGIILAALLVLLCAALFLPLKLKVRLKKLPDADSEPSVTAVVGFIPLHILPKKKKKIKLRQFSKKNFEKMTRKSAEKTQKSSTSVKKTDGRGKNMKDVLPGKIGETLELVLDLVDRFAGHLKCNIKALRISVGTEDPARTALIYAGVGTAVQAILEILDNKTVLTVSSPSDVGVTSDFVSGEFSADIDITLSILVKNLLCSASGIIAMFFRRLIGADKNKKQMPHRQNGVNHE